MWVQPRQARSIISRSRRAMRARSGGGGRGGLRRRRRLAAAAAGGVAGRARAAVVDRGRHGEARGARCVARARRGVHECVRLVRHLCRSARISRRICRDLGRICRRTSRLPAEEARAESRLDEAAQRRQHLRGQRRCRPQRQPWRPCASRPSLYRVSGRCQWPWAAARLQRAWGRAWVRAWVRAWGSHGPGQEAGVVSCGTPRAGP